jgi:hypothetical protein
LGGSLGGGSFRKVTWGVISEGHLGGHLGGSFRKVTWGVISEGHLGGSLGGVISEGDFGGVISEGDLGGHLRRSLGGVTLEVHFG